MAAICGSAIIMSLKDDAGSPTYQTIGGLRTRSIQFNQETVDVTNAGSTSMWRELLTACGVKSASMSGDGVFNDDVGANELQDAFFKGENRDAKLDIPGIGVFEGKWRISSLQFNGEYNGAVMFSVQLESAGVITFTTS